MEDLSFILIITM